MKTNVKNWYARSVKLKPVFNAEKRLRIDLETQ